GAGTADEHRMLLGGERDIGVLRHPFDPKGLWTSEPLCQTLGAVMGRNHPLARRRVIDLADLQPSTLLTFPRVLAPGLYDELLAACRAGGYRPARIEHAMRMTAGPPPSDPAGASAPRRPAPTPSRRHQGPGPRVEAPQRRAAALVDIGRAARDNVRSADPEDDPGRAARAGEV